MPWQYNKKITALWTNYQNVNAWVWVSGLGWRKLTNPDDDVTNAMLIALTHAKADNRSVDFLEVGVSGNIEIRELYVW
jgi:astacin